MRHDRAGSISFHQHPLASRGCRSSLPGALAQAADRKRLCARPALPLKATRCSANGVTAKASSPRNQRTELGDYRIADFKTPTDSIRAYMQNLNTNAAYRPFRNLRAAARAKNETLRGAPLAGGLLAYSEKGQAYVSLVRSLIARNGLSATDSAPEKSRHKRITTGPL